MRDTDQGGGRVRGTGLEGQGYGKGGSAPEERPSGRSGGGAHRQRRDDEVLFGKETVVKLSHAPWAESCRDDVTA